MLPCAPGERKERIRVLLNKAICAVRASHDKALTARLGGLLPAKIGTLAKNQQVEAVTRRSGSTALIAKKRGKSAGFLSTAITSMLQNVSARF